MTGSEDTFKKPSPWMFHYALFLFFFLSFFFLRNYTWKNLLKGKIWTYGQHLVYMNIHHCIIHYYYYYHFFFLAALGLCCCTWAFSSCSEQGLLFIAVRGLLIAVASLAVEHGL